jgi:hypothetical protein
MSLVGFWPRRIGTDENRRANDLRSRLAQAALALLLTSEIMAADVTQTIVAVPSPTATPVAVPSPTATPVAPKRATITVRPRLLHDTFPAGQRSLNALQVEATLTKGGTPVAGVDIFVSIESAFGFVVSTVDGKEEYRRSAQGQTDSKGIALFDIVTGPAGSHTTLRVAASNAGTPADVARQEIDVPIGGYRAAILSDRVTSEIVVGATFQNDYQPNGDTKGFSKQEVLFQLSIDNLVPFGWKRRISGSNERVWHPLATIHSRLDLRFSNTPVAAKEETTPGSVVAAAEPSFIGNARSFTASLNLNYQPHCWARYSPSSRDPLNPYDANRYGLVVRGAISTRDKLREGDDGDTVIRSYGAGLRYTHHQTTASLPAADEINKVPIRYLEALAVEFEEFAGQRNVIRYVIEGGLRLPGLTTEVLPLYTGFQANVGRGPDDIRIFVGVLFQLDKLASLLGY